MGDNMGAPEAMWGYDKKHFMPKINRYCRICQRYQARGKGCKNCKTNDDGAWGWRNVSSKPNLTRAHNDFCSKPFGWKVTTIFRTQREAREYMRK